jgi:hypothetical protein
MIKTDGLGYIQRGFRDDEEAAESWTWSFPSNRRTFEMLYEQLVDDHGLSPMAAVDILESAYHVAVDEGGARDDERRA